MTRLVLDVDGVVADFLGHTIATLEGLPPEFQDREHYTLWDISKSLPPEFRPRLAALWNRPGWCRSIPRLPDIPDFLSWGVEVTWATAPMVTSPYWVPERADWIREQFGYGELIFARDKSEAPGDVMVDDKPENVLDWARKHQNGQAFLWDASYNREFVVEGGQNVRRTSSWSEVLRAVSR